MICLDNLDDLINPNTNIEPTGLDSIYYIFFDKGISLLELEKLPIPYIFSIMQTHHYIKTKEIESQKKASKK